MNTQYELIIKSLLARESRNADGTYNYAGQLKTQDEMIAIIEADLQDHQES